MLCRCNHWKNQINKKILSIWYSSKDYSLIRLTMKQTNVINSMYYQEENVNINGDIIDKIYEKLC